MTDQYDGSAQSRNQYAGDTRQFNGNGHPGSQLQVLCGPLLNYQRMSDEGGNVVWHGTVLIVTKPTQQVPTLELQCLGEYNGAGNSSAGHGQAERIDGLMLYSDPIKTFWRFSLQLSLAEVQTTWQYKIHDLVFLSDVDKDLRRQFVVPAYTESMRIMFHSCNGFSVGTDEDYWSGPALWNDVLRTHAKRPFHVMIGGGDQIYNDGVRVGGPLKEWTDISNPRKRQQYPFGEELRSECDKYYFENYVRWYATEPFASANAQIAQINIWDDHDIIDGFGSYTDHFMRCAVFRGIGGVSFKYYCLFQHHTAPPVSTFTTDAPATMAADEKGTSGADPRQTKDTFVYKRTADDASWIVGRSPGPYVEERSRSLYMRLGKKIAFCGIDARTERTRKQVNYPATYDLIFDRLKEEFKAAGGQIQHLILLLGVPIAYPRLAWLENLLSSPLVAPIRLLNKRFGLAGGFFNHFDGKADLLDDLDDHYTAKHHKTERRELILRLQRLAEEFSIRITILGGDVHLGAIGRFYSATPHDTDAGSDPRYMANIISSAITNKPPPQAVANVLARRNKVHHLRDGNTDETLLKIFDKQPGGVSKGADWNYVTMPSRNYATITEIPDPDDNDTRQPILTNGASHHGGALPNGNSNTNPNTSAAPTAPNPVEHEEEHSKIHGTSLPDTGYRGKSRPKPRSDGHQPLHRGEEGAGTKHPAADGVNNQGPLPGGLNVSLRVEIDNKNREGWTEGYGFSVPKLTIHPTY